MKYNQYKKHLSANTGHVSVIVLIVITVLMTGCKKFLDVPPKDKVPQSVLFKDEQGFKDALIGVYLGMDKPILCYSKTYIEVLSKIGDVLQAYSY